MRLLWWTGCSSNEELDGAVLLSAPSSTKSPRAIRRRVVCVGPVGHVRPQWILPDGGEITVDGVNQRILASY